MRLTTKQAARGKWDGIITQLLGEQAVSRKHGPCPVCGGKDRYRYDNKRNDGDWFCNVCGVGDGFALIMDALKIDFSEAAKRIDKIVNNIEVRPFKPPDNNVEQRRERLNKVWQEATHPQVVCKYLVGRGIPAKIVADMQDVRGHGGLLYKRDDATSTFIPAMVALIRNSKGEAISMHRTYFGSAGTDKRIMPGIEKLDGASIRLGEPEDTLVLAEGIETALAAWAITGYPAWATISAHGLEAFTSIPRHVERVIVCADNDASFTGQAAAFACAKYFKLRMKIKAEVWMPLIQNMDMLDWRNEEELNSDTMGKWI